MSAAWCRCRSGLLRRRASSVHVALSAASADVMANGGQNTVVTDGVAVGAW